MICWICVRLENYPSKQSHIVLLRQVWISFCQYFLDDVYNETFCKYICRQRVRASCSGLCYMANWIDGYHFKICKGMCSVGIQLLLCRLKSDIYIYIIMSLELCCCQNLLCTMGRTSKTLLYTFHIRQRYAQLIIKSFIDNVDLGWWW